MTTSLPAAPLFGDPLPVTASPKVLEFLARRRSASALTLSAPGPDSSQMADLLTLAARVPDHGKLAPWRFIIADGEDKAALTERLEAAIAGRPDAAKLTAKLGKLKVPPTAVFVVFSPRAGEIPVWEQQLSAGAVCVNLLYGAAAMGLGANWITDWYSYDPDAMTIIGLAEGESLAGVILIGQAQEAPAERVRPALDGLVTRWTAR